MKKQFPQQIYKRNNLRVPFVIEKIEEAIRKAMVATEELDDGAPLKISKSVVRKLRRRTNQKETQDIPTVETVQDLVEETLLISPYKKTAKAYILYREQHERMRAIIEASHVTLIDQYINNLDWQVKENSNMSFSLQGLNNYVSSEINKVYWLNNVYPHEIREAHTGRDFHIHDLGDLSVYCVGWDLNDLLVQGFKGTSGKLECAPPKHLRSALGQVTNFFYTLQGEAAGAQAFSNFDTLLAPFIRYDMLSYKEVKQALQEFVFNMNVPTRVGFQTPFTNITMDLEVPSYYEKLRVICSGKPQEETYGEFQKEMDTFNKAFFEVMAEGDASGRVFTFPIPTYNITEDFDWDNKNLEGLWEISGKYGIPYFSNFIGSEMNPEDARSMCCRLRIDNRELQRKGGGLFGANPLTGSVGVVTINMPRIGHLAKNEKEFFERLGHLMDLAKESLEIKRKALEKLTDSELYPYSKFYLRDIKALHNSYWRNHFSTIGLVGMNEALENFLGVNIGSQEGQDFAERVLDFMREQLVIFQEETGNYYNLEASPAESTAYRFAREDKKRYNNIIFANGVGKDVTVPFYTNSTHLPVNHTDDMFEVLDLQDKLQTKYTGGTVIHFFLGEQVVDTSVIKETVKKVCNNYHLPYFTFTPTFSVCPGAGYVKGEVRECPKTGGMCEVYSRPVGYLRPVQQWNEGKNAEFEMRERIQQPEIEKVLVARRV